MKSRKAAGADGISIELLTHGGRILDVRMLPLLNKWWKNKIFPELCELVEILSFCIYKKGACKSYENNGRVSLLNTSYTLYARIINTRVPKIADFLLLEEQSGFRKGRSCNDNITVVRVTKTS